MIIKIFNELGPWSWMIIGFVLLALEIVVSGIFLLWIGLAALCVGVLSIMLGDMLAWQIQLALFALFSLGSVYIGARILKNDNKNDEATMLNQRAKQLVGRTATLSEAIVDGNGRARIDDSVWKVRGDDLDAGKKIEITDIDGNILVVKPL